MNDHDLERLSRYFDRDLAPAEAAAVEARLSGEPEWQAALRDLEIIRETLKDDVGRGVEDADFGALWSAVEARLEASLVPAVGAVAPHRSAGERLRAWLAPIWIPVVASAAVAALVAALATRALVGTTEPAAPAVADRGPAPAPETVPAVVVDAVRNDGNSTVLISTPAEGATVIWLLEEDEPENDPAGQPPGTRE